MHYIVGRSIASVYLHYGLLDYLMATPRGRLAPSPTGYLHLGNARSFLLAWLQMRSLGGEIVLRIEDLDSARAVARADRGIVEDLKWLGLDWDNELGAEYYQSNRMAYYHSAIQELCDRDLLYECYCSRRELRDIASAPHDAAGDYYSGHCRTLGLQERQARRMEKEPALRFIVEPDTVVEFVDLAAGPQRDNLALNTGDFIVARADGVPGYQLAVVLDDMAMGVTHVLRGNDLLLSTPRQIALLTAFGRPAPVYTHVPLMLGPDGTRLSKRHGSVALAELRAAGHTPEGLIGWLAYSCGLLEQAEPCRVSELIPLFDLSHITHSPTMLTGSVPIP